MAQTRMAQLRVISPCWRCLGSCGERNRHEWSGRERHRRGALYPGGPYVGLLLLDARLLRILDTADKEGIRSAASCSIPLFGTEASLTTVGDGDTMSPVGDCRF